MLLVATTGPLAEPIVQLANSAGLDVERVDHLRLFEFDRLRARCAHRWVLIGELPWLSAFFSALRLLDPSWTTREYVWLPTSTSDGAAALRRAATAPAEMTTMLRLDLNLDDAERLVFTVAWGALTALSEPAEGSARGVIGRAAGAIRSAARAGAALTTESKPLTVRWTDDAGPQQSEASIGYIGDSRWLVDLAKSWFPSQRASLIAWAGAGPQRERWIPLPVSTRAVELRSFRSLTIDGEDVTHAPASILFVRQGPTLRLARI